jgi:hypothetical protein
LFNVILLKIYESRHFMACLGQQVKTENLLRPVMRAADFPCNTLGNTGLTNADPVKDL